MSPLRQLFGFLLGTLEQVVFALALFMIIYLFFLQPHQVKGRSMEPNFSDGEYLLTDKVSYRITSPKRGEVIVFSAPPDRREDFIKRIIGLPGENIAIKNGTVFINQKELSEIYLPEEALTSTGNVLDKGELKLKEGEYFVLGDNRDHSSDSRAWGSIKREDMVGRAWLVYWPPPKIRILSSQSFAGF